MATITRDETAANADEASETEAKPVEREYEMILIIPGEVRRLLARMAIVSGSTEFDVIGKAIALYEVALETRLRGMRICIVDKDWEVDQEIDGF